MVQIVSSNLNDFIWNLECVQSANFGVFFRISSKHVGIAMDCACEETKNWSMTVCNQHQSACFRNMLGVNYNPIHPFVHVLHGCIFGHVIRKVWYVLLVTVLKCVLSSYKCHKNPAGNPLLLQWNLCIPTKLRSLQVYHMFYNIRLSMLTYKCSMVYPLVNKHGWPENPL